MSAPKHWHPLLPNGVSAVSDRSDPGNAENLEIRGFAAHAWTLQPRHVVRGLTELKLAFDAWVLTKKHIPGKSQPAEETAPRLHPRSIYPST